jgi:hypothetical protein
VKRALVVLLCAAALGFACSSSSTSGPGGGGNSSSGGPESSSGSSGTSSGTPGTSSGNPSGSSSSGTSSGSVSSSGGSTSSGIADVDATGDLDTLKGTVSASGVSATFSGAMEMSDLTTAGATAYYATPDFGTVGTLTANFTGPPGTSFISLAITLGETAGAPKATTLTCSSGLHPSNIYFSWSDTGGAHSVEASVGQQGASCTVSFGDPVFVTANSEGEWYFAHGSLSGTLVSAPEDGGVETGSITATW